MIFLPDRITLQDEREDSAGTLPHGVQAIVDLLDAVGTIHDGDHLQCVAFLAQELGLLTEPHFLFGIGEPRACPYSSLLEQHFYVLLREGVVDLDATGRLRLRRDLHDTPHAGLANRRLSALGELSPHEAAVFAAAVIHLARQGRYAGSGRHDAAFGDAVALCATSGVDDEYEYSVDVAAILAARQRILRAAPVMLMSAVTARD